MRRLQGTRGDGVATPTLIVVVLALVVLVVVFSFVVRGNAAEIEKAGGFADWALVKLGDLVSRDLSGGTQCFNQSLVEVSKGAALLDEIKLSHLFESAEYSVCSEAGGGASCGIRLGREQYRLDKEGFRHPRRSCTVVLPEDLIEETVLQHGLFDSFRKHWEVPRLVWPSRIESKGLGTAPYPEDFEKQYLSDVFVLYSEPDGNSKERTLIWASGYWVLKDEKGGLIWQGRDDGAALDMFYKIVNEGDNDRVYYATLEEQNPRPVFLDRTARKRAEISGKEISEIAGDSGTGIPFIGNEADELDHDDELAALKEWFERFKNKELEKLAGVESEELRQYFASEELVVEGNSWEVLLSTFSEDRPEVVFRQKDSTVTYALDFKPPTTGLRSKHVGCVAAIGVDSNTVEPAELSLLPFVFVAEENGAWKEAGDIETYKLRYSESFNSVIRAARVHAFLQERCG